MNELKLPFDIIEIDKRTVERESDSRQSMGSLADLGGITALMLCTKGQIIGELDGMEITMRPNDAFVLAPSYYGRLHNISDDFHAYVVMFDYEYYTQYIDRLIDISIQLQFVQMPAVTLTESEFNRITMMIRGVLYLIGQEKTTNYELMSETTRMVRKSIRREMVISVANAMALGIVDLVLANVKLEPVKQGRKEEVVKQFLELVYNNFKYHREINFYAEKLYLTPRYLSTLVKQKTGHSPSVWIERRVISYAKQALGYSALSVKEIAAQLHFPNQSFFGKYFKQSTGMSPKQFRQAIKGQDRGEDE